MLNFALNNCKEKYPLNGKEFEVCINTTLSHCGIHAEQKITHIGGLSFEFDSFFEAKTQPMMFFYNESKCYGSVFRDINLFLYFALKTDLDAALRYIEIFRRSNRKSIYLKCLVSCSPVSDEIIQYGLTYGLFIFSPNRGTISSIMSAIEDEIRKKSIEYFLKYEMIAGSFLPIYEKNIFPFGSRLERKDLVHGSKVAEQFHKLSRSSFKISRSNMTLTGLEYPEVSYSDEDSVEIVLTQGFTREDLFSAILKLKDTQLGIYRNQGKEILGRIVCADSDYPKYRSFIYKRKNHKRSQRFPKLELVCE